MVEYTTVLIILAGIVGVFASISDIKQRRIRDELTYPAFCIGIGLNLFLLVQTGKLAITPTLLTIGLPVAAFFLGFVLNKVGYFGGGDVKLFAAMVAFLPHYIFQILVFTFGLLLVGSLVKAFFFTDRETYFDAGEVKKERFMDQDVELPSAPFFFLAVVVSHFFTPLVI